MKYKKLNQDAGDGEAKMPANVSAAINGGNAAGPVASAAGEGVNEMTFEGKMQTNDGGSGGSRAQVFVANTGGTWLSMDGNFWMG